MITVKTNPDIYDAGYISIPYAGKNPNGPKSANWTKAIKEYFIFSFSIDCLMLKKYLTRNTNHINMYIAK